MSSPEPRPLHLRPALIGLVFIGGALGTLSRYLITLVVPQPAQLPLPTLLVNLVGAFALGLLLGVLSRGTDAGWRRSLRLFGGTGFMGGFTTYSSLAVESTGLIVTSSRVWEGIGYAILTLLAGLALSLLGIWAGSAHPPRGAASETPKASEA